MNIENKKIYISGAIGVILVVAFIWLIFRACSAGPFGENKVYHIGRDSTWYPLDLRGKEKNMVGFANDMMQAIATNQGFRAYVFEVGPNALFDGLNIGNYDAVLSSLTPNSINRRRYGFSYLFYSLGPVLVVPVDSNARTLEDMAGKIIGVESGALQVFHIQEPPDVVIIPYRTAAQALEKLDNNEIDGVILDALRAHVFTDGFYAGRLKVPSSPLTDKGLRLVTRNIPKSLLLVSQFNEGLKAIKKSGVFSELVKKWDLIDTEGSQK